MCLSRSQSLFPEIFFLHGVTKTWGDDCTHPGGGGGGTQMLFGRGCAAEAAKPVPIFKGHFGGKGYPLLGVWRERVPIIRGFYSRKLRFCVL